MCDSKYKYHFYAEKIITDMHKNVYDTKSNICINFLKKNYVALIKYWDDYKNLYNKVTTKDRELFITHGDLGVNLMIDKIGKLFIVDWDSVHLGPIERDLREYINKDTDIKELEEITKKAGLYWEFDKDYHNYFILNSLYDELGGLYYEEQTMANDVDKVNGHQRFLDNIEWKLI